MTCTSCVAIVKDTLAKQLNIESPELDLKHAIVKFNHPVSLEQLLAALKPFPKYGAEPVNSEISKSETISFFTTYKPILVLFAFLLAICLTKAGYALSIERNLKTILMESMQHFMAGFFISFSFFKFLDLKGFVNRYRTYDLLAMRIPAWALLYPFVECGLGLLYMLPMQSIILHGFTALIMLLGLISVVYSLRKPQPLQCACLGAGFNLPLGRVTLFENSLMLLMSLGMMVN